MIILEMANNHQGSLEIGKKIIDFFEGLGHYIKFQFRDLKTFLRPDDESKYAKRFRDTELSDDEFNELIAYARTKGFGVIATPFDEVSVERCGDLDFIKVASCSNQDWPLLEKISEMNKTVIVSTGGIEISQIDSIVSFFKHKGITLILMHCVGLYPLENEDANLDFIEVLQKRYPGIAIGYSGHERPDNIEIGMLATAKGAAVLERHIGIQDLNEYSMNPEQTKTWIDAIKRVDCICKKRFIQLKEWDNMKMLERKAIAKFDIIQGECINIYNCDFILGDLKGISSGDVGKYRSFITATKDYIKGETICEKIKESSVDKIRTYIHKAKGMIAEAGIHIGDAYEGEISCHYGLDKFEETGAVIISLINREYCKKLIIMFPGQTHPEHLHKIKEETFHILYGDMFIYINDKKQILSEGELCLVERYRKHQFGTVNGVIFEEISTTHVKGDSYYTDTSIYDLDPIERKIKIEKL